MRWFRSWMHHEKLLSLWMKLKQKPRPGSSHVIEKQEAEPMCRRNMPHKIAQQHWKPPQAMFSKKTVIETTLELLLKTPNWPTTNNQALPGLPGASSLLTFLPLAINAWSWSGSGPGPSFLFLFLFCLDFLLFLKLKIGISPPSKIFMTVWLVTPR